MASAASRHGLRVLVLSALSILSDTYQAIP